MFISPAQSANEVDERWKNSMDEIRSLFRSKKFEKAHQAAISLLRIQEKTDGPQSPALIETLNLIIASACAQNRCSDTTPWLLRQLELRKKILGPDHPHIAVSLSLLGENAEMKGDWRKAKQYYQQALALRRRVEPGLVSQTMKNLERLNSKIAEDQKTKH